jgi:hypothetical protein
MKGYLDTVRNSVVYGWAKPKQGVACVEIRCDGRVVGSAFADLARPDLEAAGLGACAFAFELPDVAESSTVTASVNGVQLRGSPQRAPLFLQSALPTRRYLGAQYCHGEGVEIGALNSPMPVPGKTRYVDRLTAGELRASYNLSCDLAPVDYVCDAQHLAAIPDASQDFLIANHVLEHIENPLLALLHWLRVVRQSGYVFMTIPDKRYTFDRNRAVTPFAHVLRDYEEGPEWSRMGHYRDWVDTLEPEYRGNDLRARHLADVERYPIHFHVWTPRELFEIVRWTGVEVEAYKHTVPEMAFVLKKDSRTDEPSHPERENC